MRLPHTNNGKNLKNPSKSGSLVSLLTILMLRIHGTKLIWSVSPLTSVKLNQVIHFLHAVLHVLCSVYDREKPDGM